MGSLGSSGVRYAVNTRLRPAFRLGTRHVAVAFVHRSKLWVATTGRTSRRVKAPHSCSAMLVNTSKRESSCSIARGLSETTSKRIGDPDRWGTSVGSAARRRGWNPVDGFGDRSARDPGVELLSVAMTERAGFRAATGDSPTGCPGTRIAGTDGTTRVAGAREAVGEAPLKRSVGRST